MLNYQRVIWKYGGVNQEIVSYEKYPFDKEYGRFNWDTCWDLSKKNGDIPRKQCDCSITRLYGGNYQKQVRFKKETRWFQ
jgi:hypothetical protein